MAQFAPDGEALEVPGHVLAQVGEATPPAHLAGQQLTVTAHDPADLAQRGQGQALDAGHRRGEVGEQPGATETAPPDLDAGAAGALHHGHRVAGLPDVAVAEHGDVDPIDELGDDVPVGMTGVGLLDGARMETDGGGAGLLSDVGDVAPRGVPLIDADAGLDGHRHAVPVAGADGGGDDLAHEPGLPGQDSPAALARDLGHRASEVEVDVGGAVTGGCARRWAAAAGAVATKYRARKGPADGGSAGPKENYLEVNVFSLYLQGKLPYLLRSH